MKLSFYKMDPTQNMTILIESPVPRECHQEVANRLMAYNSLQAEQVGFIEQANAPAQARLQMMGGEFCGNATMSLAALLARQDNVPTGEERVILLEVSGAVSLVECRIQVLEDGCRGTVDIPPPEQVLHRELEWGGRVYQPICVYFDGITHIVLPQEQAGESPRKFAEDALVQWSKELPGDACGLILYDEANSAIEPLVYVPSADSMVWERSCGSGTAAVGAWQATATGHSVRLDIHQPGGVITVESVYEKGRILRNSITGIVRIVAEGSVYV